MGAKLRSIMGLLPFFLYSLVGNASEQRPSWIESPPKGDGVYYFVGVGSSQKITEASREARYDAQTNAAREIFGFQIRSETLALESNKRSVLIKRQAESFRAVRFVGFKRVEEYSEPSINGEYNVWALYSYNKLSAQAELDRLKNLPQQDDKVEFIALQNADYEDSTASEDMVFRAIVPVALSDLIDKRKSTRSLQFSIGFAAFDKTLKDGLPFYFSMPLSIEYRTNHVGLKSTIVTFAAASNKDEDGGNGISHATEEKQENAIFYWVSIPFYFNVGKSYVVNKQSQETDLTLVQDNTVFLEPEYGAVSFHYKNLQRTKVPFPSPGTNYSIDVSGIEKDVQQSFWGCSVGYQPAIWKANSNEGMVNGWEYKIGIRKYSDFENLEGAVSVYIGMAGIWRF